MILMIINMVVVTKGAGRVSEVSARFTLDALPGKQMAIDADLAFAVPQLRVRDSLDLPPSEDRILLGGVPIGGGVLRADKVLAIAEGYLTVDASTVVATQLNQLLGDRPQALFGPDEMKAILDALLPQPLPPADSTHEAESVFA